MTYTFKLARRIARFRALLLAALFLPFAACDGGDTLSPDTSGPSSIDQPAGTPEVGSASFTGGIPLGMFRQPVNEWGSVFDGGYRRVDPKYLLSELSAIKSRGGKVVLMLVGAEQNYKDGDGHFSLTKWKDRVDRFKGINFSSYITDGTIIGHYLIDEPQDTANWNGTRVSQATLDAMAQYSKQYWPDMATIVRSPPEYLAGWSGTYQYLDAAWAQYLIFRWPDANTYLSRSVSSAKSKGLALIIGLNVIAGGSTKGTSMTSSQIRTYGSALLSGDYPCAFISWQYRDTYMTQSVRDAMGYLRSIADTKSRKTCRGAASGSAPAPAPAPAPDPVPAPPESTGDGLAFGLYQAPSSEYSTRWTGALYKASPADLVAQLDRAAGAQMRLAVILAPPGRIRNSDGTFNLTKWKAVVDQYRALPLSQYVTSKTLYLHHMVENPTCASCWGGKAIPGATLEEMARYSKSIWPDLATSVRATPSQLAGLGVSWSSLDAGWAVYNTRMGDLATWLSRQSTAASRQGLALMAGLNLRNASGPGSAPMTASQIKSFGTALATDPSVCALLGWKYDSSYLDQTGIRAALDSVTKVARSRTAASCS